VPWLPQNETNAAKFCKVWVRLSQVIVFMDVFISTLAYN